MNDQQIRKALEKRFRSKFPHPSGFVRPLWGLDTRAETSINFKHPLTRGWVWAGESGTRVFLSPSRAPEGVLTVTDHEIKVRMP